MPVDFLTTKTIKAWTGTNRRLGQIRQIKEWGYKMGRDFWVRRDGSLAVKSELLQSTQPVHAPTQPDFSCFAKNAKNKHLPQTHIREARKVPANDQLSPVKE